MKLQSFKNKERKKKGEEIRKMGILGIGRKFIVCKFDEIRVSICYFIKF